MIPDPHEVVKAIIEGRKVPEGGEVFESMTGHPISIRRKAASVVQPYIMPRTYDLIVEQIERDARAKAKEKPRAKKRRWMIVVQPVT